MKKNVTKSIRIKKETSVSETTTLVTKSSSPPLRFTVTPVVSEDNNNFFDDKNTDGFYKVPISDDETTVKVRDELNLESTIKANDEQESEEEIVYCDSSTIKRVIASSIVATGTGVAMMPIFNNLVKNSSKFGLDVHDNKLFLELSTANTFIISSLSSFVTMNEFIKKHQTTRIENDKWHITLAKTCASFSLIMPLGLLWTTEFNNQKVAGSSGFDEYMTWATFSSIPLIVGQITDSVSTVNTITDKTLLNSVSTVGGQIFIYGLSAASLVGRAISFTEVSKNLALIMGFSPEISLAIGIATGGVLTSSGVSILEFSTLKNLFEKQYTSFDPKKVALGVFVLAEGVWFTLPLVAVGLDESDNWNPLLKSSLFVPLAVSHSILESTKIYDKAFTLFDYVKTACSKFIQWVTDTCSVYEESSSSSSYADYVPDVYVDNVTTTGDSE